jgi:glutamyl-tRNA synthetase
MKKTESNGEELFTEEIEELIRKFALLNAIKHNGRAQVGPVIGKVLAEKPELRTKVKEIVILVNKIVDEVNSLPINEQKRLVEEHWPQLLIREKVEEEKEASTITKRR